MIVWSAINHAFMAGAGFTLGILQVILVMLAAVLGVTFPIWGFLAIVLFVFGIGSAINEAISGRRW